MAIDVTKLMVSAAMGVADEVATWWDDERLKERQVTVPTAVKEPFKTVDDILRLAATVGGLALQSMAPAYEDIGEAMSLACLPLVMKSVKAVLVKGTAGEVGIGRREFVPRHVLSPTMGRVLSPTMAGSPMASSRGGYGWNPTDIKTG